MSRKLALIIGNSHYQDPNLARLIAPGEDVTDLTEVLSDAGIGGFDLVIPLINETDAAIRLSIEDFFADKKPDDLLVIYFSGHGVRDEQGQLYLAVNNTRANRLRATAIPAEFITKEMDRSRSKRQVLILDCCHSGAFAQGAKAVTGESAGTGPTFEGSGYGRVVLTATDATQYAWEGDRIIGEADNSLFTHFMVEGLRSGAADTDGDGQITLDEMYDYVYEQVVTRTPKQTPGKWSYKQQGDIVIARNPRPKIKPVELSAEVRQLLDDMRPPVREAGVRELARLLQSDPPGLALAALEALKKLAEDDSLRVRTAAIQLLQTVTPPIGTPVDAIHETAPRLPAVTPARVLIRGGPLAGKHFALQSGVNVIGRGPSSEISLADDSSVSRRHSQIVMRGNRYTLEDLGSANGTLVNGQRLTGSHVLREGDTIAVGDTTLLFELKPIAVTPGRETPVSVSAVTGETIVQPSDETRSAATQPEQPAAVVTSDRARAEPIGSTPAQLDRRWLVAGIVAVLAIIVFVIVPSLNPPAASPAQESQPTVAPTLEITPAESAEAPQPTDEPQATPAPELPFQAMSASAPDCDYGGLFKTIESLDRHTVKFSLCSPDAALASKLALASFGIQSAQHLEETDGEPLETPLGTGPYQLVEWVRGEHITLSANPHYWGAPPLAQALGIYWNEDAAARANALKNGEVDGIDTPPADQFAAIQTDPDLKLYARAGLNTFFIGFSNNQAPFDNEQVRQALAVGIDRAAIVENYYPAGATLADYVTPCIVPAGCGGEAWYAYDPELTRALLAEAGYPDGLTVELSYRDVVRPYLPSSQSVAEEIRRQLAQLGVQVDLVVLDPAQFVQSLARGELGMFLFGWNADYADPSSFLDPNFGRQAGGLFGDQFDDLVAALDQAASMTDADERGELYAQANTLIHQYVPAIPVANGNSAVAFKAAAQGAHTSPMNLEAFRVMHVPGQDTFTWLQSAEPASLYCADEFSADSFRVCNQIFDTLVSYEPGTTTLVPALAESWTTNADATEWTFNLKPDVQFSDGTPLTANDVVMTFVVQWDAAHRLHTGNSGDFQFWSLFGNFLNR